MDGLNKFNVPLDPNEVRKIQETRRKIPTKEEILKNREIEVVEAAAAKIDEVKLAVPGTKIKEVSKPEIEEKEELTEEVRKKITELMLDIEKEEGEKEKKGEIPKRLISISVDNKTAIFTFDYFDEFETTEYNFENEKWGNPLKTPKPEFNQPTQ